MNWTLIITILCSVGAGYLIGYNDGFHDGAKKYNNTIRMIKNAMEFFPRKIRSWSKLDPIPE